MFLVTSEEMRRADRYTIENVGIPAMLLMENAGREIALEAIQMVPERTPGRPGTNKSRWLILAGKGNNGGDGIVCARHLAERGCEAEIVYAEPPERMTGEAAAQQDIARRIGIPASVYAGKGSVDFSRFDGIVDSLLGTGTSGPPREPYASLIREANDSGLPIIAADIPSGLDADTGALADPYIRASITVALGALKRGLMLYPGAEAAGSAKVRPIGIPESAYLQVGVNTRVLDEDTLRRHFGLSLPLQRRADSHKGTYGHVLVVAGSREMSGAGLLCASAALRAGSGLVTWAVPAALALPLAGKLPEVMVRGLRDLDSGEWKDVPARLAVSLAEGKQAAAIGPGLGRWSGGAGWLRELWEGIRAPLVLDADALSLIADDAAGPFSVWPRREASAVLTPHPGEMARLCGLSVPEVQRDRIGVARRYAEENGVTVVLKGARTVVAAPDGAVFVNTTGNPGMATGGSGDVLAGIIAGLLGQGLDAVEAAAAGVYLHGSAGDRAAAARASMNSLIAGDIVEAL